MTGQRKEVVQAADFLIKEGRKQQQGRSWYKKDADSLLDEAEALFLSTKERAGR
jgi:hypothetical protein